MAKLTANSAPTRPLAYRATSIGAVVHSDLLGPITLGDDQTCRYVLHFIDEFSRFVFSYFLFSKSETLEYFKQYHTMFHTQHNTSIRVLHSDNGGEYTSNLFRTFLQEQGIRQELTSPYHPHQNGLVERFNRSFMTTTRALLFQSRLPLSLWPLAAAHATQLHNRLPHSSLPPNVTPYVRWFAKPFPSHLYRVFGCLALAHVPSPVRTSKLSPRATPCIFVGYDCETFGYLLRPLSNLSHSVSTSDVVFHESIFPLSDSSSPFPPNIPIYSSRSPIPTSTNPLPKSIHKRVTNHLSSPMYPVANPSTIHSVSNYPISHSSTSTAPTTISKSSITSDFNLPSSCIPNPTAFNPSIDLTTLITPNSETSTSVLPSFPSMTSTTSISFPFTSTTITPNTPTTIHTTPTTSTTSTPNTTSTTSTPNTTSTTSTPNTITTTSAPLSLVPRPIRRTTFRESDVASRSSLTAQQQLVDADAAAAASRGLRRSTRVRFPTNTSLQAAAHTLVDLCHSDSDSDIPLSSYKPTTSTTTSSISSSILLSSSTPFIVLATSITSPTPVFSPTSNFSFKDPTSVNQALSGPHANYWKDAMDVELRALQENGTWTHVPRSTATRTVKSKWVFKTKRHLDGTLDKFKARLVAKGFTQTPGLDVNHTFASIVRHKTWRTLLAFALQFNYSITHWDVCSAFLNGDLAEAIYMEPPEGYQCPVGEVLLLRKGLYGLQQASRQWQESLYSTLRALHLSSEYCRPFSILFLFFFFYYSNCCCCLG